MIFIRIYSIAAIVIRPDGHSTEFESHVRFLNKSETLFGRVFVHITRNYSSYFGGLFNPYSRPDTENWKELATI